MKRVLIGNFIRSAAVVSLLFWLGGCVPTNPVSSLEFKILLARAEAGNTKAQLKAAEMLSCGQTRCAFGPWLPECDHAASVKWLQRAAEGGNPEAQDALASAYDPRVLTLISAGEKKNVDKAVQWYSKAAAQDYTPAYLSLAEIYDAETGLIPNGEIAAPWYEKAAHKDIERAQIRLAHMYAKGLYVPKDSAKAVYWGLKSAQHEKMNMFELGSVYTEIDPPNYEEAYYWTSLARPALANTMLPPDFYGRWPAEKLIKHLTQEQVASIDKRVAAETVRLCETKKFKHSFFCPKNKPSNKKE